MDRVSAPRLAHDLDMPAQPLARRILGFVERPTGGDAAGEIRKADAKVAVAILMDNSDVIHVRRIFSCNSAKCRA
jgi:hypothetical protein